MKQLGLYEAKALIMESIRNIISRKTQSSCHSDVMNINLVMLTGALDRSISEIFLDEKQYVDGLIMIAPYYRPRDQLGRFFLIHSLDAYIAEYSFRGHAERRARYGCIKQLQHCLRQIPKFVIQIPFYDESTGGLAIDTHAMPGIDSFSSIMLPKHINDSLYITEIIAPVMYTWLQDAFPAEESHEIMRMCEERWGHEVGDETE